TASRGTPTDASGGQGHGVLVPSGAPAVCNNPSALLLAQARTRLTTAVATAWRAAGSSPRLSARTHLLIPAICSSLLTSDTRSRRTAVVWLHVREPGASRRRGMAGYDARV